MKEHILLTKQWSSSSNLEQEKTSDYLAINGAGSWLKGIDAFWFRFFFVLFYDVLVELCCKSYSSFVLILDNEAS